MIFSRKKYRKCVFMVTYYFEKEKPKYLILKRKLHWTGYEFPKGGVEVKESKFEAVRREIFEETGLCVKKIKNHHKKGKWDYFKKLKDRPQLAGQSWSLFSVEIVFGQVKIDKKEHTNFEWLDFENALKKLTFKNQKECLEIVNNWLKK